jgi:hypothetical protein
MLVEVLRLRLEFQKTSQIFVSHNFPAISEEVCLKPRGMLVLLMFCHWLPVLSLTFRTISLTERHSVCDCGWFCVCVCVCVWEREREKKEGILKQSRRGKKDEANWCKCSMKFQISDVWGENLNSASQGDETADQFRLHLIPTVAFCNLSVVTSRHTVNKSYIRFDISLWHRIYVHKCIYMCMQPFEYTYLLDSSGPGHSPVSGSCAHGNRTSSSVKC